ncbi:MAG TPA: RsmB/NOP family class I SAM-dependent RNA methyltransferase [Acetobacteraceae bacterium]|nr:RsmB/NOP family class I SAM-dependent RNA methyltransferase [Acetobacteraceae bacterium]
MTPAARVAASIDLLAAIEAAPNRPADAVANDFFRARRFIGSGDRRAVSDRVWRVLRAWRRLGWWLARAGCDAAPRLLVGASLLTEGWHLSGLEQTFSGGRFAPAPLSATERRVFAEIEGHTLDHPQMPLPVRLEVPDWIMPRLEARFGDALPAEAAAWIAPAPLDLRVNLLKATRGQAREALAAERIEAVETPISPWGLRVAERRAVTTGRAFQSGLVEIQDEGSQIAAFLADARPGMRVGDLCAGAGGKTLALAMAMANRGHLLACDISAPRLDAAIRRLRRAGVSNVERHLLAPGDKLIKRRAGTFDRVLVDAPCTGTGTWRRNPDARLRLTEQDLAELRARQETVLETGAKLVRAGGKLIYATCSFLPEENEQPVSAFLDRHPEFTPVPAQRVWTLSGPAPEQDGFLALTPARHGTDGFFIAVLERRGEVPA